MALSLPYTLIPGTTADANQVMADFNAIVSYINNNLQLNLDLPLAIVDGGTGATSGAAACINLGALQAANNLSDVTDPSQSCTNIGALQVSNNLSDVQSATAAAANIGALQIANNLSDVASAVTALNNLLPTQTGHAGDLLTTDATNASWETPATLAPTLLAGLGFTGNMATTGHAIIPLAIGMGTQNLVINWGVATAGIPGSSNVTFDHAFPNAAFVGVCSANGTPPSTVNSLTTTGMIVDAGGDATHVFWIAIGY